MKERKYKTKRKSLIGSKTNNANKMAKRVLQSLVIQKYYIHNENKFNITAAKMNIKKIKKTQIKCEIGN